MALSHFDIASNGRLALNYDIDNVGSPAGRVAAAFTPRQKHALPRRTGPIRGVQIRRIA